MYVQISSVIALLHLLVIVGLSVTALAMARNNLLEYRKSKAERILRLFDDGK